MPGGGKDLRLIAREFSDLDMRWVLSTRRSSGEDLRVGRVNIEGGMVLFPSLARVHDLVFLVGMVSGIIVRGGLNALLW